MIFEYKQGKMSYTRLLSLAGVLTSLAVIFQIFPVFFTEVFVMVTMLSALPIYIIERLDFKMGIAAFVVTGVLVMLISVLNE